MTVDLAKRRRVMQRSQQLGHCVCDPRRPCPCAIFREQNLCPCAGERPASNSSPVKLTELAHHAGCASKIPAGELEAVLSRLPAVNDPAVISGIAAGDDAGIYQLNPTTRLVQTVDVMTPCVDDAYTFGRICAVNCLSDIYAMMGTPRTALSILAYPHETLDGQVVFRMLQGAMEVFAEANVALIGGHSLQDVEIKLGFAITGTLDAGATEHDTAAVGDVLVLTKPLGVGVLNFARQIGRAYGEMAVVEQSMAMLNRSAAEAMREAGATACTDVTGFGLFGHLISMCRHSGVTARIYADGLPAFPGALDALRDGVVPGAIERNMEYVGDDLTTVGSVEEARLQLGFDAQTSGGLLIAIPCERVAVLTDALTRNGVMAAVIGEITEQSFGRIEVASSTIEQGVTMEKLSVDRPQESAVAACDGCCCAEKPSEAAGSAGNTAEGFNSFMRAASADGAIDARTKELINFALVVLSRCAPCLTVHYEKARKMGITDAELEEAAWSAVAMGGAPVRMFYLEAVKGRQTKEKSGCCQ